ncbi:MAG: hypothetical protein LBQ06_06975 [Frankiaceae bacterium]|jgi:hypothetical protein|nr:hypothetical protein [Frankiaceae bacterium]
MVRRDFDPGHNRGRALADVVVMPADGGGAITDIDVLRQRSGALVHTY